MKTPIILLILLFICPSVLGATYVFNPITDNRVYPHTQISPSYESSQIHVRTCPGEYIAATFVIRPTNTINFLPVTNDLTNGIFTISKDNIDIKGVKCWYQRGDYATAPITTRLYLPELLLNDDSLVQVNEGTNHLKTKEYGYISINNPDDPRYGTWNNPTMTVEDSESLLPISLQANQNKQYWITVYVPENTFSGTYEGGISLRDGQSEFGTIQLTVEVLPFTLPESPVEQSIYYVSRIQGTGQPYYGGQPPRNSLQVQRELEDLKKHGITNPNIYAWHHSEYDNFVTYNQLRKNVGMSMNPIYYLGYNIKESDSISLVRQRVQGVKDWYQQNYGTETVYIYCEDESDMTPLASRIMAAREVGGLTFNAQGPAKALIALNHDPPLLDLAILNGNPLPSMIEAYHAKNLKIGSYSNPQAGEEKPLTYRRNYGLLLWQRDVDVAMTFAYCYGHGLVWNDWHWPSYKQEVFSYPTANGVVNTIQFEGYREGVNDVRYLQKLIDVINDNPRKDTSAARQYVDNLKTTSLTTVDLDGVRNDIINYILVLDSPGIPGFETILMFLAVLLVFSRMKKK